MEIDIIEIGNRIANARLEKGLTQEQLAERLDISNNFLSVVETGKRKFSLDKLIAVANELDLSLDYLIYGRTIVNVDNEYKMFVEQIYDKLSTLSKNKRKKFLEVLNIVADIFKI